LGWDWGLGPEATATAVGGGFTCPTFFASAYSGNKGKCFRSTDGDGGLVTTAAWWDGGGLATTAALDGGFVTTAGAWGGGLLDLTSNTAAGFGKGPESMLLIGC
jgi:hypothetical protein